MQSKKTPPLDEKKEAHAKHVRRIYLQARIPELQQELRTLLAERDELRQSANSSDDEPG